MIIGLMGYSGSGKSTFANLLKNLGAYVIDADEIGKNLLKKGSPALKKVIEVFGEEYLLSDGSLNRKKLGDKVFNSEKSLELLNSITFPQIERETEEKIKGSKEKVTVVDCALLCDMKIISLCDEVIFFDIPRDLLIERIIKRDNISEETAKGRLKRQEKDYKKYATYILENKDIEALKKDARNLMEGWLKWQKIFF